MNRIDMMYLDKSLSKITVDLLKSRSSHVLSLERGHRTAQPRVNYTSSLADSLDIRRTNILSSRTGLESSIGELRLW